jgi:hypothetical protein
MKNVSVEQRGPVIKIPMTFLPPLQGWTLRLLEDLPQADFKKGQWMSNWQPDGEGGVRFAFGPERHLVFNSEAQAKNICEALRNNAEIETEVVKIGDPQ